MLIVKFVGILHILFLLTFADMIVDILVISVKQWRNDYE